MGFDIYMAKRPSELPIGYRPHDVARPEYYRFRASSMAVMLTAMEAAQVAADDPAPVWPSWPPPSLNATRAPLLEQALRLQRLDAHLTAPEQQLVLDTLVSRSSVRATRSRLPGRVPAFKFRSNDGWIVSPEECAMIAAGLARYAHDVPAAQLRELDARYQSTQQELMRPAVQRGEVVLLGNESLRLTLEGLRAWLCGWAAYNELAAQQGGYRVE